MVPSGCSVTSPSRAVTPRGTDQPRAPGPAATAGVDAGLIPAGGTGTGLIPAGGVGTGLADRAPARAVTTGSRPSIRPAALAGGWGAWCWEVMATPTANAPPGQQDCRPGQCGCPDPTAAGEVVPDAHRGWSGQTASVTCPPVTGTESRTGPSGRSRRS